MSRILIVLGVSLLIPSSFAAPDILPVSGTSGILDYDAQTGAVAPVDQQIRRIGRPLWVANQADGSFLGLTENELALDWGDVSDVYPVGVLGFSEFTNSQAADGDNTMIIVIYGSDNGWNTPTRQILAGYMVTNIPGSIHPSNEYWGYVWRLEPSDYFLIDGADLDGDDLVDFSYAFWPASIRTLGAVMGPGIAGDIDGNNIPPTCPGVENAYDLFGQPDFENDPNLATTPYLGTYWFGGNPFAQFYWEMFAPGCPNAGAHFRYCSADVTYDCIVDIHDLAECLHWFGIPGVNPCDIYPPDPVFPGDGVFDLQDLAELLGQYGDDCNWPQ